MKTLARYRQECQKPQYPDSYMADQQARQAVYDTLELRHTWGPIMRHMRQIKEVLDRAKEEANG